MSQSLVVVLGGVHLFLGKFTEAHALYEQSVSILKDLRSDYPSASFNVFLGAAKMHLGQYEQARAYMQLGLTLFREVDGYFSYLLGSVALAGEAYAEAHQLLEESVADYREVGQPDKLGMALAAFGYAARGLGNIPQARQHLAEALRTTAYSGAVYPLITALPAVALLLADQGKKEQAVELYALASRYPFVANSRWFEDVAGRRIAAIAATLPPEIVAAAQERGRARDLNDTVAELSVELECQ